MILNSYVKSYDQKIGVKKSWVRSAQVFLLLNREFHSVHLWEMRIIKQKVVNKMGKIRKIRKILY